MQKAKGSFHKKRRVWLIRIILLGIVFALGASAFIYVSRIFPYTKWGYEWVRRMPPEKARDYLHRKIESGHGPKHDLILMLRDVANKDSIPVLIPHVPPSPESQDLPLDCGYGHSMSTLMELTNHCPGFHRKAWEEWWEAHRDMTLEEIRIEGFRKEGAPVSTPPNEEFASALVRMLTDDREYLKINAYRMLNSWDDGLMDQVIDVNRQSPDTKQRLGLIEFLGAKKVRKGPYQKPYTTEKLKREEEFLRALTKDPDAKVRKAALTKLNWHKRAILTFDLEEEAIQKLEFDDVVAGVFAGTDDSHILVDVSGKLVNLDLSENEPAWTSPMGGLDSLIAMDDDHIFFRTRSKLVCLDAKTGNVVWEHVMTRGAWGCHPCRVLLAEGLLLTATNNDFYAFKAASGEQCWTVPLDAEVTNNDLDTVISFGHANDHFFVLTQDRNILQLDTEGRTIAQFAGISQDVQDWLDDSERPERARERLKCRVMAEDGLILTVVACSKWKNEDLEQRVDVCAYSAENLKQLWSAQFDACDDFPEQGIILLGDKVVCCLRGEAGVLDRNTGEKLWTEEVNFSGGGLDVTAIHGDYLVCRCTISHELRRVDTGEVIYCWPEPASFRNPMHASSSLLAMSDMENNLWLLKPGPLGETGARTD